MNAGPRRPRVEVVVVTYNSAHALPGLMASLDAGLTDTSWQLTVADNQSADDSVAVARQHRPQCRIVQTGRNAGYAAAFNAAVADLGEYDAVLILNPDVRLGPGSVAALYRRLGEPGQGRVGVAVPRLSDEQGRLARSLRREPSVLRALGEAFLGYRAGGSSALGETVLDNQAYERATIADWATGAAMLIGAECLAETGAWDESFFLYSEETDFCLRARDRGYATILVPEASAVHLGGDSRVSPELWSLLTVNRVRLYRRRHSFVPTALFWSAVTLREGTRAALGHRRSRAAVAALLRPSRLAMASRSSR